MAAPDPAALAPGKLVERLGGLVELVTTLDQKILNALRSLEDMEQRTAAFEDVNSDVKALVADLQQRVGVLDERLHADLDDVKAQIMEKIGELDVTGLGGRIDRLEAAVFNIERATVNLDRAFEGGLEMLPDFVSKRLKGEADKKRPARLTPEADASPGAPSGGDGSGEAASGD